VNRGLRFLRDNSLGLVFLSGFLITLVGQAIAGHADFDNQLASEGLATVSLPAYLTSSDFAVDVTENWQSEYLQFFLYIFGTVWLLQRGSPESKEMHKAGTESDEDQMVGEHARKESPRWARDKGWRGLLYSRSLGLVMGTIFVLSWLAQSITGVAAYNEQQLRQLDGPVSWGAYLTSADFWARTLQNWQSELLAVASMAVLSIYLRQRGSPESKPVGAAHHATGVEG
jgi:membrane protein implicated in regulation of membrane protease activity